jgi:hypothetical protein
MKNIVRKLVTDWFLSSGSDSSLLRTEYGPKEMGRCRFNTFTPHSRGLYSAMTFFTIWGSLMLISLPYPFKL